MCASLSRLYISAKSSMNTKIVHNFGNRGIEREDYRFSKELCKYSSITFTHSSTCIHTNICNRYVDKAVIAYFVIHYYMLDLHHITIQYVLVPV